MHWEWSMGDDPMYGKWNQVPILTPINRTFATGGHNDTNSWSRDTSLKTGISSLSQCNQVLVLRIGNRTLGYGAGPLTNVRHQAHDRCNSGSKVSFNARVRIFHWVYFKRKPAATSFSYVMKYGITMKVYLC